MCGSGSALSAEREEEEKNMQSSLNFILQHIMLITRPDNMSQLLFVVLAGTGGALKSSSSFSQDSHLDLTLITINKVNQVTLTEATATTTTNHYLGLPK